MWGDVYMTLPIKTYWPSLARETYNMCRFITKHQAKLIAICTIVSAGDVPAVAAAFTSIATFCTLFEKIHSLVDPNAPPNE
jgi:hypothetical protein